MFNEKKAKMDPSKPPFPPGPPGVPHIPGIWGRGFLADEQLMGRDGDLGVRAGEVTVGRARGLAVASEEPLMGRARGLAVIVDEPSMRRARGLFMTADETSVSRARAPAGQSSGRGRAPASAALDTTLFAYGRGRPGLSTDRPVVVARGTEEKCGGDGFGRTRGLLHASPENVVGRGRSMSLFVKASEPPGEREEVFPCLQEEEPPKFQASMKKNLLLHPCCCYLPITACFW